MGGIAQREPRAPASVAFSVSSTIGLRSAIRFWACCLPHVLLAPIAFLGVTFLHELAHAAAVLVLGGQVTGFTFLPSTGALGRTFWSPGPGWGPLEADLVSVAPYLMWSAFAGITLTVATLPNRFHWVVGSSLFLWCYAAPIGDIAWNLTSSTGDLAYPGPEGLLVVATGGLAVLVAYLLGFYAQRRLLPGCRLTPAGYLLTTFVLGAAFASAGLVTLTAFGL